MASVFSTSTGCSWQGIRIPGPSDLVPDVFSYADIENLARRHDPDLDLGTILDHLAGVSVFPDEDFAEYGLDATAIASLRAWVTGWYDDLARRLVPDQVDGGTLNDW